MPLAPGQILENRYRIVKLLGQGGFGAVYRAWDIKLSGPCAVKESFETSPAVERQFSREASLLFNLRHPNLPRVFDSFVIPNQGLYLVMDFIEGRDLQEMLNQRGGPLPESQVLPWIEQVCAALSYLHSRTPPIIHRDIKPANVRITPEGQAVLVDFGIAKVYDPNLRTTAGARAVTPGFSPHEQYGQGTTDARSDIYALGATLYTLLTGAPPVESIQRVVRDRLTPARQLNASISPAVAAAIGRALCVDPEARFQSAAEFKRALNPSPPAPLPQGGEGGKSPGWAAPTGRGGTVVVPTQPPAVAPAAPPARPAAPKKALLWGWIGVVGVLIVGVLGVLVLVYSLLLGRYGEVDWSATWTALPTPITDASGASMALIPAGEFQMGSTSGSIEKQPVHTVYLDDFYIDVYEVTNARYTECAAAGKCDLPQASSSNTHGSYYGNPEYADYPVIYVTWSIAQAYCEWRGGSLPTEAQWEKAARGGLQGATYPWGDESPTCTQGAKNGANYWFCSPDDTMAVGSFSPNGYGLYDMAGNVWEWVWDWYSSYSSASSRNPSGPESGEYRVLRGGGWFSDEDYLRAAYRSWVDPTGRSSDWGFRCARSP